MLEHVTTVVKEHPEPLNQLEKSLSFADSAQITKDYTDETLIEFLEMTDIRLSSSILLIREGVIRLLKDKKKKKSSS